MQAKVGPLREDAMGSDHAATEQLFGTSRWISGGEIVMNNIRRTEYFLALSNAVVAVCTACFNTLKLCILPTQCICVPHGSHNKQRLFPQTALTGWAL
jgi:hypothetical protein